jgi:hypothetical protein
MRRVLFRAIAVVTLTFAFATPGARAFFDPPWIAPAAPRSGDVVTVNMRMGICDARVERPGYPQITRQGNAIRLVVYGHHWDTTELCIYPIATGVEAIGAFSPGDYTVTVDFVYDDYPFGLRTINLGVIPFSVASAAPVVEVPASTPSGLIALLVLMGCLALSGVRMRRD